MKKNGMMRLKIEYEGLPVIDFETKKTSELDDAILTFKKKIK